VAANNQKEKRRAVFIDSATFFVLIGRSHGELGRLIALPVQLKWGQMRWNEWRECFFTRCLTRATLQVVERVKIGLDAVRSMASRVLAST